MAAVVLGTITDAVHNTSVSGSRHIRIPVTVTTTGDTYAAPFVPTRVAWEATNTTDDIAVTASGATVTFTGTNGSVGFLHAWSGS